MGYHTPDLQFWGLYSYAGESCKEGGMDVVHNGVPLEKKSKTLSLGAIKHKIMKNH